MADTNTDSHVKKEAWQGDKLDRLAEGKFVASYLINKFAKGNSSDDKSFVLNINADWGFGKTYFLRNLLIEFEERSHPVVYFDAWKNDFSDKPMLGFIAEINDSLSNFMTNEIPKKEKIKTNISNRLKSLTKSAAPLLAGMLAKHLVGLSFEQINSLSINDTIEDDPEVNNEPSELQKETTQLVSTLTSKAAEMAMQEHVNTSRSIDVFKINLKQLVNYITSETDLNMPLFILVDELDRCRPNYAIELLETIKHLFQVEGVYFIVATASDQLSHSIKAVYGRDFESKRYLNRFFDQEYKLAEPNQFRYCQYLWNTHIPKQNCFLSLFSSPSFESEAGESNMNIVLVNLVAQYTRAGLRDIEQAIKLLKAISLTQKDDLLALPVIYLVFCKVRHPDLYFIVRRQWPNIYGKQSESSEVADYEAEHFDMTIHLNKTFVDHRSKRNNSTEKTYISSAIREMTQLHGLLFTEALELRADAHSARGLTAQYFKGTVGNSYDPNNVPRLEIDHYIDIVEQVGRLGE